MKHRRHPNFPSYRFYSDRRIMNKTTNRFIKVKPHMKLFSQLFPNLYSWEPYKALRTKAIIPKKRIKRKYTKAFINKVKEEANTKTYDELIREYNIPMGTIGYLLKKGRSSDNGNIVININRVIIRK